MTYYKQLILFGPPGTGKSYAIKKMLETVPAHKIFRVTIHPEFSYSDFVGQLLPDRDSGTFVFKKGPFTQALVEAYRDTSQTVYLILEELSRGNVSAIFGDIFQLLDRDEHFTSKYPIRNIDISEKLITQITEEISLPANFNIICTVNMNDQSVYPMDTAFKRRFEWQYVSTDPATDDKGNVIKDLNNPKVTIAINDKRDDDLKMTWQAFYTSLNSFITDSNKGLGKKEDKQVGQFFIDFGRNVTHNSHLSNGSIKEKEAIETVNQYIKNKLLNYLWQDVQGARTFKTGKSLFDASISSYDELYKKANTDKIFSDDFIESFLKPNRDKYPYK